MFDHWRETTELGSGETRPRCAEQIFRVKVRRVCSPPFPLVTDREVGLGLGHLSVELCCRSAGIFPTTAHIIFLPLSDSVFLVRSTICYISKLAERYLLHFSRAGGGRSATFELMLDSTRETLCYEESHWRASVSFVNSR